jgi:dipeptidase D
VSSIPADKQNGAIREFEPKAIWSYFVDLCEIPRPSKQEEKALAYLQGWAKQHAVGFYQDAIGNVYLDKPASSGCEDLPGMILQAHIDMVCEKQQGSAHDFYKDPLSLQINDGWVCADGTTLGADNGIGVAAILAVFSQHALTHGPLEALITVDEEAGMGGALNLEPGKLKGSLLLNLDSEQNGDIYIGCAGGVDIDVSLPIAKRPSLDTATAFVLRIAGLRGGHSGLDINKGRANAISLLCELLQRVLETIPVDVYDVSGGSARNAIPRDAMATIGCADEDVAKLESLLRQFNTDAKARFSEAEPALSVTLSSLCKEELQQPDLAFSLESEPLKQALARLLCAPNGALAYSPEFPGVVESSSNLSTMALSAELEDEVAALSVCFLTRSLDNLARDRLALEYRHHFDENNVGINRVQISGAYPGWKPDANSLLFNELLHLYAEIYDAEASVKVIHAGLECGLIQQVYPHLDMISFGPTIHFPHSPEEKLEIASVSEFWLLLTRAVQELPRTIAGQAATR